MSSLRGRASRAAVLLLILLGSIAALTALTVPASAAASDFTVKHGASGGATLPRGAFLTVTTTGAVTDETATYAYPNWPTATPGGLYVELNDCYLRQSKRLPIVSVRPTGGGNEIKVYFPNNFGPGNEREVFGTCASGEGAGFSTRYTVGPKAGFGDPVTKFLGSRSLAPGIFAVGSTPDGYYENGTTGARTPLSTCAADPARCPTFSGSTANKVVVFTTGGEYRSCNHPGLPGCGTGQNPVRFQLAPVNPLTGQVGDWVNARLVDYGYDSARVDVPVGKEAAEIDLTIGVGGQYRLRMLLGDTPQGPDLTVRFSTGS